MHSSTGHEPCILDISHIFPVWLLLSLASSTPALLHHTPAPPHCCFTTLLLHHTAAAPHCCCNSSQVPHAQPWAATCSNILAGRKCGARGAPCKTSYVCSSCTPGSAWPIAYCEGPAGIWRVQGTCVAGSGMADCPNRPQSVANAEAWPSDCVDGSASVNPTVCNANCAAGFTGEVVATCSASGWVVAGTCVRDGPGADCPGTPEKQPNANDFADCTDKTDGEVCDASW